MFLKRRYEIAIYSGRVDVVTPMLCYNTSHNLSEVTSSPARSSKIIDSASSCAVPRSFSLSEAALSTVATASSVNRKAVLQPTDPKRSMIISAMASTCTPELGKILSFRRFRTWSASDKRGITAEKRDERKMSSWIREANVSVPSTYQ
jgi:hypothetical protein